MFVILDNSTKLKRNEETYEYMPATKVLQQAKDYNVYKELLSQPSSRSLATSQSSWAFSRLSIYL